MGYRVIGDFAAVTIGDPDGNGVVNVLERGAIVPEGVHDSVTDHLVTVGLVESFEAEVIEVVVIEPVAPIDEPLLGDEPPAAPAVKVTPKAPRGATA